MGWSYGTVTWEASDGMVTWDDPAVLSRGMVTWDGPVVLSHGMGHMGWSHGTVTWDG